MMPTLRAALALVLSFAGACAPVVTHAPRVEPGSAVGLTLSVRPGACTGVCPDGDPDEPAPAIGGFFRHGWVPADSTRPSFLVGVFVPFGFALSLAELDVYAQAPARAKAPVFGGGLLLSAQHLMPYVQLGRTPPGGAGLYTTQGAAWHFGGGESDRALYWVPSLAYRFTSLERNVHFFVSGGVGSRTVPTYGAPGGTRTEPLRFLMLGVTGEFPADAISLPPLRPRPRRPPRRPSF